MSDVVAFLRARLDEDEASARPLIGMPGALTAFGVVAQFIASTSPERVLREVEAKRSILGDYEEATQSPHDLPPGVHDGRDPDERIRDEMILFALEDVVCALAAVYRDHPDYDEAWTP